MGALEFVVSEGPEKGRVIPVSGGLVRVGSAPDCEVRLLGGDVAPCHAELRAEGGGGWTLRDLSGGRLWMDGRPVASGALRPGSFLRLGNVELAFRERLQTGPSGTIARGATPTPRTQTRSEEFSATVRRPVTAPGLQTLEVEMPGAASVGRPAASSVLPPGSIIDGRYEVLEKLAEGGMGEVYRAQHVELGKPLALKVMRPELSDDPEFVARFKREAISAGRIGQLNIIDVSDFGRTAEGRFYFVMEFLDGVTVTHLLRSGEGLPVQRVVHLVSQVVRALTAAHSQGIVHRDLKPDNIMVLQRPGQPDFVKVLDFGIAKVTSGKAAGGNTAVGMVVGTPQYMAPEQAQGLSSDARTDIYALGLILYELLRGRPAFDAETPSMLMIKQATEPPPRFPGELSGQLPKELEGLVFKMLEKAPDARPQAMEEVLAVLERCGVREPAAPPPEVKAEHPAPSSLPPAPQQRTPVVPLARSRMPLVVGGAVAVMGVLGAAGFALRPGGAPAPAQLVTPPAPPPVPPVVVKAPPAVPPPPEAPPPEAQAEPKQAEPAPPPSPAKAAFKFTATPVVATVLESDMVLGVTPFRLEREAGTVLELTFQAPGYQDARIKVRFESDQDFPVVLQPLPVVPPVQPSLPRKPAADKPTGHDLKDIDL